MKFKKKVLSESVSYRETSKRKTYSEKPQTIIITESQLERLIEKLSN
jgi:hypothetical protein